MKHVMTKLKPEMSKFFDKFDEQIIDGFTSILTSKQASNYRTIDTIESTPQGKIYHTTYIQIHKDNVWKYIPNKDYLLTMQEQEKTVTINDLPTKLKNYEWNIMKNLFPQKNRENYQFNNIFPKFPQHIVFEKKYPEIISYLEPKKN